MEVRWEKPMPGVWKEDGTKVVAVLGVPPYNPRPSWASLISLFSHVMTWACGCGGWGFEERGQG